MRCGKPLPHKPCYIGSSLDIDTIEITIYKKCLICNKTHKEEYQFKIADLIKNDYDKWYNE